MKNILIIGGGAAAKEIINEINNKGLDFNVVGFLDDNQDIYEIEGVKNLGNLNDLNKLLFNNKIDEVFICIPSLTGEKKRFIINLCIKNKVKFKVIPSKEELILGKVSLSLLKKPELEDLIGRTIIKTNEDLSRLKNFYGDKIVLVTGGAGSIGSELVRQLAYLNPKLVLVYDWWENGIYDLQYEMKKRGLNNIEYIIGDVKDKNRLKEVFTKYNIDYVFHAAAYKHVPLMEENYKEAIKNNLFGTKTVAEIAIKYNVKNFLLISTDKAVKPSSIMGITKRLSEIFIFLLVKKFDTIFSAVRFGNVFNSRGSVVPLLTKQIFDGGPVTITHKDIVRYFMTISEAVFLVLNSMIISKEKKNNLFILDMGESIKILDLAESLIRFFGYEPYTDIKIKFIGLRPGEKLYEELITKIEKVEKTDIKKIYQVINSEISKNSKFIINKIIKLKNIISKKEFIYLSNKIIKDQLKK